MKRTLSLLLISLLLFSGCAWFQSKEEKPAADLASDGMEYFNSGKYKKAIDSFEKLKDWYPFSKYAVLAELKIGDAHYRLKEYEEAIYAYEEFEKLHPLNEAAPYAIYQIGLCHFEQIDAIDRDQTSARMALETFQRLVSKYPESHYAAQAREHIQKCFQSLAGHELYVGIYYYKGKHYKAALERFKAVLTNYPDTGVHHQALEYISLCEDMLRKQEKGPEVRGQRSEGRGQRSEVRGQRSEVRGQRSEVRG